MFVSFEEKERYRVVSVEQLGLRVSFVFPRLLMFSTLRYRGNKTTDEIQPAQRFLSNFGY